MPFFKYLARDSSGRPIEGNVNAGSEDEVVKMLRTRGLSVERVGNRRFNSAGVEQQPPPTMQPISRAAPVSPAASQVSPVLAAKAKADPSDAIEPRGFLNHTKERELYFATTQLAAMFKAGFSPHDAFSQLAGKSTRPRYAASYKEISEHAQRGGRVSDILKRDADLYPPSLAALIRIGEDAGCLPEAMQTASDQLNASVKLQRWLKILQAVAIGTVVLVFAGQMIMAASLNQWDALEKDPNQAGAPLLMKNLAAQFRWPFGPLLLASIVLYYIAKLLWASVPNRGLRHKLVLFSPFGKRARAESLGIFTWALGQASRAGLSPATTWRVSAETCPNVDIARKLKEAKLRQGEGTKLSELLAQSNVIAPELQNVVQTGEIVGDVSGALEQVANHEIQEYRDRDRLIMGKMGCWAFLITTLGAAIGIGLYYGKFFMQLMNKILNTD
ncbi:MAG: type II secretion system F family protein [Armatimonadetes bacterium]|nr:type II secretion system F family protein [Armatimonadota bacterium]